MASTESERAAHFLSQIIEALDFALGHYKLLELDIEFFEKKLIILCFIS